MKVLPLLAWKSFLPSFLPSFLSFFLSFLPFSIKLFLKSFTQVNHSATLCFFIVKHQLLNAMISEVLVSSAGVQTSVSNLRTQVHKCPFLSLFPVFLSFCNSLSCLSLSLWVWVWVSVSLTWSHSLAQPVSQSTNS